MSILDNFLEALANLIVPGGVDIESDVAKPAVKPKTIPPIEVNIF